MGSTGINNLVPKEKKRTSKSSIIDIPYFEK